jgi:hypothetical protein
VRVDARRYAAAIFDNELRRMGVKVLDSAEGADATLSVQLTKVGQTGTQVELEAKLKDGTVAAARSVQAMSDGELYEMLRFGAREVAGELFRKLQREPVTQAQVDLPPPPPEYTPSQPGLLVALAGAVAIGGGIAMDIVGKAQLADVHDGRPATWPAAMQQANTAQLLATAGIALIAVGGVALVGGAGYAVIVNRRNAALEVTGFVGPSGGGVVFGGRFP